MTFQMFAMLTCVKRGTREILGTRIYERFFGSRCFAYQLFLDQHLSFADYEVINQWTSFLDTLSEIPSPETIVYIRAEPELCFGRMSGRHRNEEANVSMQYINNLHDLHEDWLIRRTKFTVPNNCDVIILDGSKETKVLVNEFTTLLK